MTNRDSKAFPATDQLWKGMDLRDYFAAHAVQGLLANPEVRGTNASLAADAYDMADQMMEERSHD